MDTEGTKYFYKEDDETLPVNVYTSSKVAAEQFISANYSNFAILRSSIIYGPQTVSPVPKSLPVQVNTMNFTLFLQLSNFTKGLFCSLLSSSRVADVRDYFQLELHLLHWVFQCYIVLRQRGQQKFMSF